MKPIQIISQDLFDKVRSRFQNLEMGDETGAVTINPAEARFFDFDFVVEGNNMGRVSISINDLGSLKVYYSQGITENHDAIIKRQWFGFLKEMRMFAMRRLLRFDTRDITKTNLDKNDFQHLATTQGQKETDMTTMNESRWSSKSSKKTSRAVQGRTEVIVRHAKPVDEEYAGSRSQRKNIKAIFIQNADGERFKYPFIHPAGAFAMAQHVDHGGIPHDPAGKAIIRMSEEIAKLGEFQRKIHSATLHDDATGIKERAIGRLNELKAQMECLGKRGHYEKWISEFNENEVMGQELNELDPITMEDYKQKFTQTSFQEDLAQYFPLLHKIMSETNTVELEDYVSEEKEECEKCHCDPCECDDDKVKEDAFDAFEEWAESVEQGKLTDDQLNQLKQAISELPDGKLQLGPNGQTAIQFFSDLGLDSSDLQDKLEKMADVDSSTDAMEVFKAWAKDSYPELLVSLGISSDDQQPENEPAPTDENEEMGGMPNKTMPTREAVIREVAKLVKSRFNEDNPSVGPFNGKENIALDIKKKCAEMFGEDVADQCESLALDFMEKLSKKWEQKHGHVEDDGLARLKELLGNVKEKVESIGDVGGHPGQNIMPAEEGLGSKIAAGVALLAALWGVDNHLANQAYEASPQLQKLTQFYHEAEARHDVAKMKELERRIEDHKTRLDLGYGDVMDKTGNPKEIVPEMADILKLSGLAK
jgi:hypothetical protein